MQPQIQLPLRQGEPPLLYLSPRGLGSRYMISSTKMHVRLVITSYPGNHSTPDCALATKGLPENRPVIVCCGKGQRAPRLARDARRAQWKTGLKKTPISQAKKATVADARRAPPFTRHRAARWSAPMYPIRTVTWLMKRNRVTVAPARHGDSALVSEAGLEPARCYPYAPQTYASANSATPTLCNCIIGVRGCGFPAGRNARMLVGER